MAKYAFGYIFVLLVGALALVVMGSGQMVVREGFAEVPPVEAPEPLPAPSLPSGELEPELDLVVVHANGLAELGPFSYCFVGDSVANCGEGFIEDPPEFISTLDDPLRLSFPMEWSVEIQIEPDDLECGTYVMSAGVTTALTLEELGPVGGYLVQVHSNGPQGSASWALRVDNQSDLPFPAGVSC
jgi:hypothetical protein